MVGERNVAPLELEQLSENVAHLPPPRGVGFMGLLRFGLQFEVPPCLEVGEELLMSSACLLASDRERAIECRGR